MKNNDLPAAVRTSFPIISENDASRSRGNQAWGVSENWDNLALVA